MSASRSTRAASSSRSLTIARFECVRVDEDTRTIPWPGDIDLDPDVRYGTFEPASGVRLSRNTARGPTIAAQRA